MHPITGSCKTNFYTELQEFILLTKMKEVVKIDQNLAIKKKLSTHVQQCISQFTIIIF